MKSEILTKVRLDWEANLPVIQSVIRDAEEAVLSRTDNFADPMLDSPNLANLRGQYRWILVPKFLEQAVNSGRLPGITAHWVPLGGVSAFELRGTYTSLSPYHLQQEAETPRRSTLRRAQRIANETFQPLLLGFEHFTEPVETKLLHLLLVHGEDNGEFAFLRAYYDGENPTLFRALSENIMIIPTLLDSDESEPITDPSIGLKQKEKKATGGDHSE